MYSYYYFLSNNQTNTTSNQPIQKRDKTTAKLIQMRYKIDTK